MLGQAQAKALKRMVLAYELGLERLIDSKRLHFELIGVRHNRLRLTTDPVDKHTEYLLIEFSPLRMRTKLNLRNQRPTFDKHVFFVEHE
jgi:hypothetical protein